MSHDTTKTMESPIKPKNVRIDPDVLAVLKRAVIDGNQLTLPGDRLSPDLYKKVNKVLELAGGKWTRKVAAHVFPSDPREALGMAVESGVIEDRKQTLQAFYTLPELARRMVMHLGDLRGKNCLEPSAGHGAIALAMREAGGTPYCVEIDEKSRDVLAAKAMAALVSQVMPDGDAYDPPKTGADFVEDENARWYASRDKTYWFCCRDHEKRTTDFGKAHQLVTTYHQRFAREAYAYADAMLSARKNSPDGSEKAGGVS